MPRRTIYWIIWIVLSFLVIILLFNQNGQIINYDDVNGDTSKKTATSQIPGINYTCEDLVPEEIEIFVDSLLPDKLGNSVLSFRKKYSFIKNGISLAGFCEYNSKPGQKASRFNCDGYFIIENKQISDDGIIQEKDSRTIEYNMVFDDEYCEMVAMVGMGVGVIKCEILSSSCKWKYGTPSINMDIYTEYI
ncbi:hypothetical protein J4225_04425 [Candidatus Pacearchaeota archaeon]|nr:hypothetical protein [Candidatus Pacearchaeota archaeon]